MELQSVEASNIEINLPPPEKTREVSVNVTLEGAEEALNEGTKNTRSIDQIEKERLLTECKNQIQVGWVCCPWYIEVLHRAILLNTVLYLNSS